jgi:hypothetical protein
MFKLNKNFWDGGGGRERESGEVVRDTTFEGARNYISGF